MPTVDLTITISVILAISAIVVPFLTTVVENVFRVILKKIELKQSEYERTILYKRKVLENYLKYLNLICQNDSLDNLDKYSELYPLAYIYAPDFIKSEMKSVNHSLKKSRRTNIVASVDKITVALSTELQIPSRKHKLISRILHK